MGGIFLRADELVQAGGRVDDVEYDERSVDIFSFVIFLQ